MSHKALYRAWRPERFDEVVGQDHIVKVLTGQITSGRIAHAYLFAGPRGTGKTSMAKIFARAVNCMNKDNAEPCGKCNTCKEIDASGGVDIVEIDAASNNGVDSVRDLRDRVSLLPALCRFKVYIIDEVHMLSTGAFNALLKTLEEPPSHVIFILATTEPHKLPATIRSRCQRFDFKRIPISVITSRLAEVSRAEGYVFDDNALKIIARAAEGGMRDALSILDQCTAFGNITSANVTAALGGGDVQMVYTLAEHIASYNEKGALEQLRAILDAGADTRTLIKEIADIFRRMMWICAGSDLKDTDERLKPLAKRYGKNACIRALGLLIQKEYEMRLNLRADIVLETAIMALMCPEDDETATDTHRIEKLEARVAALENRPATPAEIRQPLSPAMPKQELIPPEQSNSAKHAGQKTLKNTDATNVWRKLLNMLKKDAYFIYSHAHTAKEVKISGGILKIKFDSDHSIAADYLKQPAAQKAILANLEEITASPLSISIIVDNKETETMADVDALSIFGMDIEEI
ncbi:MAG: DNA polymerase III subunit gamma/tau [Christensenellales bacterium]|jgi:DNA polymerase-3 subunit gamma/tau